MEDGLHALVISGGLTLAVLLCVVVFVYLVEKFDPSFYIAPDEDEDGSADSGQPAP